MKTILLTIMLSMATVTFSTLQAAELPSSNAATINSALTSGRPSVVDFGARSCIPCKKMAPILEELNRELSGKANVIFNDVWKDNSLAGKYRIQMIPTQVFFNAKGKEVKRHMGFMEKAAILQELKAAGMK
jgi:thioredoxin 1